MWVQAGPPGCIGHSSASGWQDADGFLKFLQHVQSVTNAIPGNEILFIMAINAHIDGLVQDGSNSSALTLELLQSCAKPSICFWDLNDFRDFSIQIR